MKKRLHVHFTFSAVLIRRRKPTIISCYEVQPCTELCDKVLQVFKIGWVRMKNWIEIDKLWSDLDHVITFEIFDRSGSASGIAPRQVPVSQQKMCGIKSCLLQRTSRYKNVRQQKLRLRCHWQMLDPKRSWLNFRSFPSCEPDGKPWHCCLLWQAAACVGTKLTTSAVGQKAPTGTRPIY